MNATLNQQKTSILNRAAKAAERLVSAKDRAKAGRFVRAYYTNVSPQDLVEKDVGSLAGGAMAIMKFGAKRRPGQTIIRVYNPDAKRDGWSSDHTIIEVISEDMPFLVDSVTAELARQGITVHLVVHPVIRVVRGSTGTLQNVVTSSNAGKSVSSESYMGFEISYQSATDTLTKLEKAITTILRDVRLAVEDWQPMRAKVARIIDEVKLRFAEAGATEVAEAQDFLQWAYDNNFTFLGYREYEFKGKGNAAKVSVNTKTGLGILRNANRIVLKELRNLDKMPAEIRALVRRPDPVVISKADVRSTVHRAVMMDTIAVKKFDSAGKVIGERLIVGLFTSVAYSTSPREIPLLRRKLDKTVARAGFPPASHDGKALTHILETYPRDELFQTRDDDLLEIVTGILHLQERQRVAMFVRYDDFGRYSSCLLYVPRDNFTTRLRLRMQAVLEEEFQGEVLGFNREFGDSALARLHVIISTPGRRKRVVDIPAIEARLADIVQSWSDRLSAALVAGHGEKSGSRLCSRYADAFPTGYAETFSAEAAIKDIAVLEDVDDLNDLKVRLYRPDGSKKHEVRFKVFHPDSRLPLSDVLPVLEDMGLKVIDEVPHEVKPVSTSHELVMIHDFGLASRDGAAIDFTDIKENFEDVFARIWRGDMESDGFNALVLNAGLSWRQLVILRTYAKYLKQAKAPFSQVYMETALRNNPATSVKIVEYFESLFDPAGNAGRTQASNRILRRIEDLLEKVQSADEDRILRRFLNAVQSTLRTNFYQTTDDGAPKSYLSIKLDSGNIDELPLPRPLREIFVYAPRFEAIHLRGGLVARGGLRWSDRPEDFRTEILGLMKAQMVKNAVIVPVGSKGGFVVKRPPTEDGREAFLDEGIACYKMFMGGLLDITDNLDGDKVVVRDAIVRRDADDPYLVVAADKGTATFSDIANGVSESYGHWLGDAYASGGSVGYDHKKMGITAKGAWESVKRHFREIGKDIQNEDFSVVGVGDMSGDVFGNGMLLSRHIKLLAAFNHLHIFIDPDPDPGISFAERRRMFNMPRSSWTDYNAKLISKGGGIFERSAKSITVSSQMKQLFGIAKAKVTPNELLQAILRAQVELMWFGGIGTYIKSTHESDADAGDRANDAIRVDATELNCQVIGEGANLGTTQRGRIQFAENGGRLNTDSVDNSAGVDCSDHEVNIKILLDAVVASKKLNKAQRNKLLESMTDEVSDLVLMDNYLQTQSMTLVQSQDDELLDIQARFIRMLEKSGRLDRAVEYLPDDETLAERGLNKKGLTRPEIAVVMPYAKLWMYDEILASKLPDTPELRQDLVDYFPTALRKKYATEIFEHKLKREIIATVVTNSMINRVGGTFVTNLMEKSGARPVDIARAYIATRDAFDLEGIWQEIEALDNKVSADMQVTLLRDVNQLIERAALWLLRHSKQPIDIGDNIGEFRSGIAQLETIIEKTVPTEVTERVNFRAKRYVTSGIPAALAKRVAYLLLLVSSLDIIRAAASCRMSLSDVAVLYFRIGEQFGLGWLRYNAEKLPADNHWQKLAAAAVIEELYGHQRGITLRIVKSGGGKGDILDNWTKRNAGVMEQTSQMLSELEATEQVDLSMLAVASRHLSTVSAG